MLISRKVIHGSGVGKQLGFPTANLDLKKTDINLSAGVYVAKAFLDDKEYLASLTILEAPDFKFEVHLLDYTGEDFYGEILEVEVGEKVSELEKFEGLEGLKVKIKKDLEKIREVIK
ncbi:MAG: riboflavin kinase [Candidatus Magasanikbacteria bacterium]